jgi:WD40 repeat protein
VGVLNLWEASSGVRLYRLINHVSDITSVGFNASSNQIASADVSGVLSLSPVDGTVGVVFARDPDAIQDLVYTPDGRLVSANASGVWIWDLATGSSLVLEPVPSVGAVDRLAVSWDGKLLAALGHDGTTWVWDLNSYQLVAAVTPADWSPLSLAFSPVCQACPEGNGWTLAIGGEDGNLSLWGILPEAN